MIGTLAMSVVLVVGGATGLLGTPPPKVITGRAERKTGLLPSFLPKGIFRLSWLGSHVAYGMGSGALYSLLRPLLPRRPLVAGVLYGSAVWVASYVGVMPALGLYPPPKKEERSTAIVMIAAHWVYGAVLAMAEERL